MKTYMETTMTPAVCGTSLAVPTDISSDIENGKKTINEARAAYGFPAVNNPAYDMKYIRKAES